MADAFLLVHGGLHGAWCWDSVVPLLDRPALAIDLPGRSGDPAELAGITYDDWVDEASRGIDALGVEQVCVASHSLGGITALGLAAARPELIASLVFLSSVLPADGETAAHAIANSDDTDAMFAGGVFAGGPPEILRESLMNGVDDATAKSVIDRLRPEPVQPFLTPMRHGGLPNVAKTYIRLGRDQGLPPAGQERMIENLAITDVRFLDTCHNAMVSEPEALAGLLRELGAR